MRDFPSRFLPGTPLPLRVFALGFAMALSGAAMAFSTDYGPDNALSYVAFALGVAGAGAAFVGIALGLLGGLRRSTGPGSAAAVAPASPAPRTDKALSGPDREGSSLDG